MVIQASKSGKQRAFPAKWAALDDDGPRSREHAPLSGPNAPFIWWVKTRKRLPKRHFGQLLAAAKP
jgi:hypothetical protein